MIASKNGRTVIIQAKRYDGVVGNKAVQEVIAARHFYNGHDAWVITNSVFSRSAEQLAHKTGVLLIDGHALKNIDAYLMQWNNQYG